MKFVLLLSLLIFSASAFAQSSARFGITRSMIPGGAIFLLINNL